MNSIIAYIGLGSNLAEPVQQVRNAYQALEGTAGITTINLSPLYRSKAVGPGRQPDYLNAAAQLKTTLSPIQLLEALQGIEHQQQRVRAERWGPRTIDLDLLLYGDIMIDTPRLTVPHSHLKRRNFVLAPLLDLNIELRLPDNILATDALTCLGMTDLTLLAGHDLGYDQ